MITSSISGYAQYDIAGNVVKAIDPRSTSTNIIATAFDFSDAFGAPDGNAEAMTAAAYGASLVGSYVCVRDEGDYGRSVSAYPFVDSAVGARYGL